MLGHDDANLQTVPKSANKALPGQLVQSSPPVSMLLVVISLAKHKSRQPSVLQRFSEFSTGSTT